MNLKQRWTLIIAIILVMIPIGLISWAVNAKKGAEHYSLKLAPTFNESVVTLGTPQDDHGQEVTSTENLPKGQKLVYPVYAAAFINFDSIKFYLNNQQIAFEKNFNQKIAAVNERQYLIGNLYLDIDEDLLLTFSALERNISITFQSTTPQLSNTNCLQELRLPDNTTLANALSLTSKYTYQACYSELQSSGLLLTPKKDGIAKSSEHYQVDAGFFSGKEALPDLTLVDNVADKYATFRVDYAGDWQESNIIYVNSEKIKMATYTVPTPAQSILKISSNNLLNNNQFTAGTIGKIILKLENAAFIDYSEATLWLNNTLIGKVPNIFSSLYTYDFNFITKTHPAEYGATDAQKSFKFYVTGVKFDPTKEGGSRLIKTTTAPEANKTYFYNESSNGQMIYYYLRELEPND